MLRCVEIGMLVTLLILVSVTMRTLKEHAERAKPPETRAECMERRYETVICHVAFREK